MAQTHTLKQLAIKVDGRVANDRPARHGSIQRIPNEFRAKAGEFSLKMVVAKPSLA
jgi:hypothetical protein